MDEPENVPSASSTVIRPLPRRCQWHGTAPDDRAVGLSLFDDDDRPVRLAFLDGCLDEFGAGRERAVVSDGVATLVDPIGRAIVRRTAHPGAPRWVRRRPEPEPLQRTSQPRSDKPRAQRPQIWIGRCDSSSYSGSCKLVLHLGFGAWAPCPAPRSGFTDGIRRMRQKEGGTSHSPSTQFGQFLFLPPPGASRAARRRPASLALESE